jgi:Sec23/Sec24 zinc finger
MADIPRCSECGAYINCYSGLDSIGWRCSVCGTYSEYTHTQGRKYSKPAAREQQAELHRHVFEALCPAYNSQAVQEGTFSTPGHVLPGNPACDALKAPVTRPAARDH